ncbi:AAA family ATPase [soil metagenome]
MTVGPDRRPARILVLGQSVADDVRTATSSTEPHAEITACEQVHEVAGVLTKDGPFDVMVAGPALADRAGLARVRAIREELPHMSVVLAFTDAPDSDLAELVRAGAVDLIKLPADPLRFGEGLGRAVDLARLAGNGHAPAIAAAHPAPPATTPVAGKVYTVASASGGCGKTFFAANLAWFLHTYTGRRVCIVDLDLQFGEVSTALRMRPRYAISDLLQRDDEDGALVDHIDEYTEQHDSGVHILAAPQDPTAADRITPLDVKATLEAARMRFDYVIVDTPPALTETVLSAYDISDELQVMATLDLPSIRNLSVFLGTLERLKVPQENIRLILNKAEKNVGIEVHQILKLFPQGFDATLPYAKEVSRSINVGMPVLASNADAEISRLMTRALTRLLPPDATMPDAAANGRGWNRFSLRSRSGH